MRKIHLFVLALVAMGAFSALATSSAFAELVYGLANWLEDGKIITTNRSSDLEGELLFENLLNGARILCSDMWVGTVGANGIDEVTEELNLSGEKVGEGAGELGIVCTPLNVCEVAEIRPDGLPFLSELMLDETAGVFLDLWLLNGNNRLPSHSILCRVLGINVEELCEMVEGAAQELSNAATDVESLGALEPEGTCNGNAEDGLIENNSENVALTLLLTGTLSESE